MYIKKHLKSRNPAKPRLVSFKDSIESFSKKALLASMVIGSSLAPIQAYAYPDTITSKGRIIHQKDSSMTPQEKKSLGYLFSILGSFAVLYAGCRLYISHKREKDKTK
jgi:hypothetical protein